MIIPLVLCSEGHQGLPAPLAAVGSAACLGLPLEIKSAADFPCDCNLGAGV